MNPSNAKIVEAAAKSLGEKQDEVLESIVARHGVPYSEVVVRTSVTTAVLQHAINLKHEHVVQSDEQREAAFHHAISCTVRIGVTDILEIEEDAFMTLSPDAQHKRAGAVERELVDNCRAFLQQAYVTLKLQYGEDGEL